MQDVGNLCPNPRNELSGRERCGSFVARASQEKIIPSWDVGGLLSDRLLHQFPRVSEQEHTQPNNRRKQGQPPPEGRWSSRKHIQVIEEPMADSSRLRINFEPERHKGNCWEIRQLAE